MTFARLIATVLVLAATAAGAQTTVYTVTNTAATGPGSLAAALVDLQACPAGEKRVEFNIPAATDPGCNATTGICVIATPDTLQVLCGDTTVDGYTQPGSSPNTRNDLGNNARIRIELAGSPTTQQYFNMRGTQWVFGFNSAFRIAVRGIAFPRTQLAFYGGNSGSSFFGGGDHVVSGNWFGFHADGSRVTSGQGGSLFLLGAMLTNNRIGGSTPGDRNLFTYRDIAPCCELFLPAIGAAGVQGSLFEGNFINVDPDGNPINVNGVAPAINLGIGASYGVPASNANLLRRNVMLNVSFSAIAANGDGNTFTQNVITTTSPSSAAISLSGVGNRNQAAPVVGTVTYLANEVVVRGTLQSVPGEQFVIELFHNATPNPQGGGRAELYVGSTTTTTDGSGAASFQASLPASTRNVSMTATRISTGDTSQFGPPHVTPSVLLIPPLFTSLLPPSSGRVGVPYSHTFTAAGTPGPSFAIQSGALPPGITLTPSGALIGTPTGLGTFTATVASSNGVPPDATQGFTITILPGDPASVSVTGGSGQSAIVGAAFAQPLVVVVRDAGNNPIANVSVDFAGPNSGASAALSSSTATTDASGAASITATANLITGSYTVSAIVAGVASSASFSLTNLALPDTQRPTAVLNAPRSVVLGSIAVLEGLGSFDPGGTITRYRWSPLQRPAGATAFASPVDSTLPSFFLTPDVAGTWTVALVVTDAAGNDSLPVQVSINVTSPDTQKPTAVLNAPRNVVLGSTAVLEGVGSFDPGGTITRYRWSPLQRPAGAAAFASPVDSTLPSFFLTPDVAGTWTVALVVTDAAGNDSLPVQVSINVTSPDTQKPTAILNAPRNVVLGSTAVLEGVGSFDPGGTITRYRWSPLQRPAGATAFASPVDSTLPSFFLTPDVAGTWTVSLVVTDAAGNDSLPVQVSINVTVPTVTLAVTRTGGGTGSIASSPAGISCGTTCTAPFAIGAVVTLTATPAAGSRFVSWGGVCAGTAPCVVTMDQAREASARFEPIPVGTAPRITSAPPPQATSGVPYTHQFTASGTAPITFAIVSGALPPGLVMSPAGLIGGTPIVSGSFAITVRASNGVAPSAEQAFSLVISAGAPARLVIVSGNRQVGAVDPSLRNVVPFAIPLTVQLIGADGSGIAGQRIEFTPMALDPQAATAILGAFFATTDRDGRASVNATPAGAQGMARVRARLEGFEPVYFELAVMARAVAAPFSLFLDPRSRDSGDDQVQVIHAPFERPLTVKAFGEGRGAVGIPALEVRFFPPHDPKDGEQASAILEGGTAGRVEARDSKYSDYVSVVTGSNGDATVRAVANGRGGTYHVIAVLVEEGGGNDPSTAPASRQASIRLTNLDALSVVIDSASNNQRQRSGLRFANPVSAMVVPGGAKAKALRGGIAGAELWFFAGDEARGEAGANLVAPGATEGRLSGGERYLAIVTNADGVAEATAIANRFQGKHTVRVTYPGAYSASKDASVAAEIELANTSGAKPNGAALIGNPAAGLEIHSGNRQYASFDIAPPGLAKGEFPNPLIVRATNADGTPVQGALVRFVPQTMSRDRDSGLGLLLTDSLAFTDENGLAQVRASVTIDDGTFPVRASIDSIEQPVEFTLFANERRARVQPGMVTGLPVPGSHSEIYGDGQSQVVLGRFDEPLAVSVDDRHSTTLPGSEVRFFVMGDGSGAAFEPENGEPGVLTRKGAAPIAYRSVIAGANGIASLKGLANGHTGKHEVVAVLVDPAKDADNDPRTAATSAPDRVFTFHLTNVAPGVVLERLSGNNQTGMTGMAFDRSLRVSVGPEDTSRPRPAPAGVTRGSAYLDGAEIWFIVPIVGDEQAGATLLGGEESRLAANGKGVSWRVVSVPVDANGNAEVTAVANLVRGSHRVIAAYPGTYTDPANAPFKVEFTLCNAESPRGSCQ